MQLLQITLEHVRLHRQLNLPLASGITVLEGANESGKSTLAEAIHRALFLPARTAGAALNQLRTRPFEADPTISLQFSADGNTYQLRKTFAGSRGSVSLSDAAGSVLEGERAEERLAQLVGASAVRGGNLGRLRERWAHLWVWQGQAGVDPLSLAPATIDQERLLQQLQHQAQTIQSGFDQQIQQAIRQRWSLSHTDGGREGRAGSELDRALKAEAKAA
ncbi:MAG TPA: ABC transporter, partial [Synechococcales bacterium UBA8647]|nr:ABC transporter [Synechococcales bacterium UBA8647]